MAFIIFLMSCYFKCPVALPGLTVSWVGLLFAIVVFPDHANVRFYTKV